MHMDVSTHSHARNMDGRFVLKAGRRKRDRERAAAHAQLQRVLNWCRRYEEPAALLVARLPGAAPHRGAALLDAFRVSDTVALEPLGAGHELRALLLDRELDRPAVERRLDELLGEGLAIAWVGFPDDGVTLQTLIETAHRQLHRGAALGARRTDARARRTAGRQAARLRGESYADA
jgi:hypothetical protein